MILLEKISRVVFACSVQNTQIKKHHKILDTSFRILFEYFYIKLFGRYSFTCRIILVPTSSSLLGEYVLILI